MTNKSGDNHPVHLHRHTFEALDIDSMDFLNFVIALHHRLGVDIAELDYPKVVTLDGAATYLKNKLVASKS